MQKTRNWHTIATTENFADAFYTVVYSLKLVFTNFKKK